MEGAKSGLSIAFAEVLQHIGTNGLGPHARHAAKQRILDMLSVTFDGLDQPVSGVALRSVGRSVGPCTVIGRKATAAAPDAAFVNAVTSHITSQMDCGGGGHPGTFVIPVSLALGEQFRSAGEEVLKAVVVGYEAAQRVHMAAAGALHSNGFRAVPAIGVFGAAAAASVLSALDTRQLANALNFAAQMAGGFYECFADGTMEVDVHAGLAARAGITAAALAEAGGQTSESALDGPAGYFRTFARGRDYNPDALTDETGDLGVLSALSKPIPGCTANQKTMETIRLLQPAGFQPSEIERVIVARPAKDYDAPGITADPPYHNMLQALLSAKFTSAAALLGKPMADSRYFKKSFGDADVEEVALKTTLLVAENKVDEVTVEVFLKDGASVIMRSSEVTEVGLEIDLSARFEKLATPRLHGATQDVLDVVANLETAPDIGRLMQLMRV